MRNGISPRLPRELLPAIEEFAVRADPAEIQTLLRILRRWPAIRAVTKDALFAAVVAEYRAVLEVVNVPAAWKENDCFVKKRPIKAQAAPARVETPEEIGDNARRHARAIARDAAHSPTTGAKL